MVVNMLKNWRDRHSSPNIIKFVYFISIYYAINLNSVPSFMVFNNLYIFTCLARLLERLKFKKTRHPRRERVSGSSASEGSLQC